MAKLGVNIDHIATLRQARRTYEPDPVWAAVAAQLGGADGITMHLREDRRHIQDDDVHKVQAACQVKLNLEMAATDEMVAIACRLKPDMATLVPEGRLEVTTEGGLNVAAQRKRLQGVVQRLKDAGLAVSAFIDADARQVAAAAAVGFDCCEIHTGPYAAAHKKCAGDMDAAAVAAELKRVAESGRRIIAAGMKFNAGHALTYVNVGPIAALPLISELHIGHAIISRAVFVGLQAAVAEMKRLIREPAPRSGEPGVRRAERRKR
jgi:pyridoxine 5-phosphate synthase